MVIYAERNKATASAREDESRHIFGVKCKTCGHITYFDKRRVCPAQATIVRRKKKLAGVELDELELKCGQCGEKMTVHVDCEGYR